MRRFTASVEQNLRQVGLTEKQQAAAAISLQRQRSSALISQFKQEEREATRSANSRLREESRALRQKIAEENRAAREVARITADTARQAVAQERIRERAAKQLADVQIREARRAARELERTLAIGRQQGGDGGSANLLAITGTLGRIPALSGITSELSAVASASSAAGAASASLAGPIGLVAAGLLAEAGAAAAVSKGLFDLTKKTAEYRGALFDMSQQVGISVETLSALEVLAATTGGSIETVAASIAIFQRNLEASHDPTSKEAKLLRDLGVTSTETEEALRQTLTALFAMGEGSAQTTAVLELFGRSGRFVNAILKESQGDLDKAIEKFRELGIIVSTEDAKAADEFNDLLATVNFQLRGLVGTLGQEVMPFILGTLTDLQKLLKDNKEAIQALGVAAQIAATLLGVPFKGSILGLQAILETHKVEVALIVGLYKQWAELLKIIRDGVPEVTADAIPAQPLGREDGPELLRKLQKAFLAAQNQFPKPDKLREMFGLDKATSATADPGIALLKQLQAELRRLTGETKAQEIAAQLLDDQYKNTNAQLREQIRLTAGLIDFRRAQSEVDQKIREDAERKAEAIVQERNAVIGFMDAQELALRGPLTELDKAERFIAQILASSGNVSGVLDEATRAAIRFNAALLDSKENAQRLLEILRESAANIPAPNLDQKVSEELPSIIFDDSALGIPPPPDFSPWRDAITGAKEDLASFRAFALDSITEGINGVAAALAQGVEAWALYGESIGVAMKKALAASAARIAGEAAFQGALHAAYAVGSLAFLDFRGAAQHAIAAAKFFAIAAIAGLGAKRIAGNTFQQGPSGGSTSGAGGSRGELNPVNLPRNSGTGGQPQIAPQTQPQRLEVRVTVAEGKFADAIKTTVVEDFNNAGPIREVIANDGGLNRG